MQSRTALLAYGMALFKLFSFVHLPGNFLVLNEALVIIDLDMGATLLAGDNAALIPSGPSDVSENKTSTG